MERIDFIFSYWIFTWYLLYIAGIVHDYNPKIAIICGIIENLGLLSLMLYYKTRTKIVIFFVVMLFLVKIIPLTTLWNDKLTWKDFIATLFLFVLFLIWREINHKPDTFSGLKKKTLDFVKYNRIETPGIYLLDHIFC